MSMEKPKTHLQWFTQIQSNGTIKDPPCVFKACYDRDSLYPSIYHESGIIHSILFPGNHPKHMSE